MTLVYKDRVLETSTTTGTGAFTLAGTLPSFQTFAAIGDGNTCYYTITAGSEWEVGLGTYTASGTSLSRDVVLDSSNSGSLVNFAAGTKTVFVTFPADVVNTTPKTYPSAGIAVSTGSAWGTSKTTPTGDVVGTTDTQSLTNKTISMSGLLTQSAGADIASASTVDLTAATGNCPKITGTTAVTAWTMNTGQQMKCIAGGAFKLVYDATTNNVEGGADYTCAAGDIINLVKGLDGVVRVRIEEQGFTYPKIKPSLNLDFANVRRLDPRITFTRASSGTYFNEFGLLVTAAANVPRFDYNPVTGESLGLLIEEQRTNLLRYSEQFDNAAWTKANTTITANAEIAPDGLLTADKLVENTANSTHTVENSATLVSGTTYTSSVSIKAGGRPTIQMVLLGTAFTESRTWFDLSTGVSTTTIGTIVSASIVSQGNGWYRVSVTQTATASGAGTISLRLWNGSTALYTGDGTSGIYIWGAQLEVGAFPTSYIKTEGSQVTRAADSAVMTGSNFSNWYNPLEGTFVAEYAASSLINNPGAFAAGDSSLSFGARSTIYLVNSSGISGRATLNVSVSGATQAGIAPAYTPVANTLYKVSASYKVNDFAICVNGGSVAVDTNGSVPTATNFSFSIGSLNSAWVTGSNHLNGTIKRIAYYPRRLSDAQLQALTG